MSPKQRILGLVLAGAALTLGCDTEISAGTPARFLVEVSGETFRIEVRGAQRVAAFQARLTAGQRGVITGPLRPGSGGFNQPWSWHLDPDSVTVADLAVEVCDGRPSFVEEDLDYWFESVGQFCPWGALVVERQR